MRAKLLLLIWAWVLAANAGCGAKPVTAPATERPIAATSSPAGGPDRGGATGDGGAGRASCSP